MKETRQLKVFPLSLSEVELKPCIWQHNIEPCSSIVIPTPISWGGCVVIGLETITYYNKGYNKPLQLAKVSLAGVGRV